MIDRSCLVLQTQLLADFVIVERFKPIRLALAQRFTEAVGSALEIRKDAVVRDETLRDVQEGNSCVKYSLAT